MMPATNSAMPTAAKLSGALVLALWGWYIAGLATPFFVNGVAPWVFVPACILAGLVLGWAYVGRRAGYGYLPAVGYGITAGFAFCVIVLFVTSFGIMVNQAMRLRYDGPMEALVSVFELMWQESLRFIDAFLLGNVFIGAVVCAWFIEYIARRYP